MKSKEIVRTFPTMEVNYITADNKEKKTQVTGRVCEKIESLEKLFEDSGEKILSIRPLPPVKIAIKEENFIKYGKDVTKNEN